MSAARDQFGQEDICKVVVGCHAKTVRRLHMLLSPYECEGEGLLVLVKGYFPNIWQLTDHPLELDA